MAYVGSVPVAPLALLGAVPAGPARRPAGGPHAVARAEEAASHDLWGVTDRQVPAGWALLGTFAVLVGVAVLGVLLG